MSQATSTTYSKQHPLFAGGVVAVTGSKKVNPGFPHGAKLLTMSVEVESATASELNTCASVSTLDNKDGTFTIYAWKNTATSNNTLIAATAAINVRWAAIAAESKSK